MFQVYKILDSLDSYGQFNPNCPTQIIVDMKVFLDSCWTVGQFIYSKSKYLKNKNIYKYSSDLKKLSNCPDSLKNVDIERFLEIKLSRF
jgi:hypothetical protein|nr:MAG TPA: hypothetical protein [Caudoviricetes sp.]